LFSQLSLCTNDLTNDLHSLVISSKLLTTIVNGISFNALRLTVKSLEDAAKEKLKQNDDKKEVKKNE